MIKKCLSNNTESSTIIFFINTTYTMFLNIRFPEDISYGAIGGPNFNTSIETSNNGYETRFINWLEPKSKYNVSHCIKNRQQIERLIAFFYITRGKGCSFRFKDWLDYRINNQVIREEGDTNKEIKIYKDYRFQNELFRRQIKKDLPT